MKALTSLLSAAVGWNLSRVGAQAARKGNAGERTLGNDEVTLGSLPASQTKWSDSAHLVCRNRSQHASIFLYDSSHRLQ